MSDAYQVVVSIKNAERIVAQSGPDARETYRFPVRRRCVNRREGLAGYRKRSHGSAGIIATRGSGAFAFVLPEARVGWARTCLPGPSPNRPRRTLRGDGTASLDDREFRGILRSMQRKVVFSGAVAQPNEAPHAGYFAVLRGRPWRYRHCHGGPEGDRKTLAFWIRGRRAVHRGGQ